MTSETKLLRGSLPDSKLLRDESRLSPSPWEERELAGDTGSPRDTAGRKCAMSWGHPQPARWEWETAVKESVSLQRTLKPSRIVTHRGSFPSVVVRKRVKFLCVCAA